MVLKLNSGLFSLPVFWVCDESSKRWINKYTHPYEEEEVTTINASQYPSACCFCCCCKMLQMRCRKHDIFSSDLFFERGKLMMININWCWWNKETNDKFEAREKKICHMHPNLYKHKRYAISIASCARNKKWTLHKKIKNKFSRFFFCLFSLPKMGFDANKCMYKNVC